jgi:hypothetical protein
LVAVKPTEAPPATGDTVAPNLRVDEYLGRGAAGFVYRVTRLGDGERLALKWYDPNLLRRESEGQLVSRRLREAAIGARVRHPNVVRTFEPVEEPQRYLLMELLEGRTLEDEERARGGRVRPIAETYSLVSQLASGVAALHSERIFHRDIKPANIMCCNSGRIVLLDLGVARPFDEETITESRAFLGTLGYSAPEWVLGTEWGAASEVYSIGAVLYRLLTGKDPFEEQRPYARKVIAITSGELALETRDADPRVAFACSVALMLLRSQPSERPALPAVREFFAAGPGSRLWTEVRRSRIRSLFAEATPEAERIAAALESQEMLDPHLAVGDRSKVLATLADLLPLELGLLGRVADIAGGAVGSRLVGTLLRRSVPRLLQVLDEGFPSQCYAALPRLVRAAETGPPDATILSALAPFGGAVIAAVLKKQTPRLDPIAALKVLDRLHLTHSHLRDPVLIELARNHRGDANVLGRLACRPGEEVTRVLGEQIRDLAPIARLPLLRRLQESHTPLLLPELLELAGIASESEDQELTTAVGELAVIVPAEAELQVLLALGDLNRIRTRLPELSLPMPRLLELARLGTKQKDEALKSEVGRAAARLSSKEDLQVLLALGDLNRIRTRLPELSLPMPRLLELARLGTKQKDEALKSEVGRAAARLSSKEEIRVLVALGDLDRIGSRLHELRDRLEKADEEWSKQSGITQAIGMGILDDDEPHSEWGSEAAYRGASQRYDQFLMALRTPRARELFAAAGTDVRKLDPRAGERSASLAAGRRIGLKQKLEQLEDCLENSPPDMENDMRLSLEIASVRAELSLLDDDG